MDTLTINTILQNRYQVIRLIGRGGQGAVYEAIDLNLGNLIALKENASHDEQTQSAFEREARLLAKLFHPALPKVSHHFTDGNRQFLVMEYVPGDSLADLLQQRGKAFPLQDVMIWGDQLLDALDYLHTQP